MSVETVRAVVGEDGINIAVETLKTIAANERELPRDRLDAAHTLLSYGLADYDNTGTPTVG